MAISTINSAGTTGVITSGTAQNSTSGTSIDFTGIPSWVKRVTVMFNGVSTSGTSNLLVQLGSGSIQSTGYTSRATTAGGTLATSTAGFLISSVLAASDTVFGSCILNVVTGNTFVGNSFVSLNATQTGASGSGVSLSGAIDRVRITTVNGTDTFDAGSINILYE